MTHPLEQLGRPKWLPFVDLRGVTRDANAVMTYVEVLTNEGYFLWLRFGSLDANNTRTINAKYDTATDHEHDSAYAFCLDVVGLSLSGIYHGKIELTAYVPGSDDDSEAVRVPRASILKEADIPKEHEDDEDCPGDTGEANDSSCNDPPHRIVRYVPPPDKELWKHLRGRCLKITVIPNPQSIDEQGMLPPIGQE
jgi:hypothetical protein